MYGEKKRTEELHLSEFSFSHSYGICDNILREKNVHTSFPSISWKKKCVYTMKLPWNDGRKICEWKQD